MLRAISELGNHFPTILYSPIIDQDMGLDINGTKFLLFARRYGVSYERTLMIGRQGLHLTQDTLASNLRQFGINLTAAESQRLFSDANGFAEPLFRLLGANECISFDKSSFEGASVVYDFNDPIPDEYKGRFTAVFDGGSLEHIFDFPTAIRNCMEAVELGGYFLAATPANNFLGHGFYQFSPELYFRIFDEENGFEIKLVAVYEETPGSPWYEVCDPRTVNERVTIVNDCPTTMLVIAKKIRNTKIFASMPLQSDYLAMWDTNSAAHLSVHWEKRKLTLERILRIPVAAAKRGRMYAARYSGILSRKRRHFKKINLT